MKKKNREKLNFIDFRIINVFLYVVIKIFDKNKTGIVVNDMKSVATAFFALTFSLSSGTCLNALRYLL